VFFQKLVRAAGFLVTNHGGGLHGNKEKLRRESVFGSPHLWFMRETVMKNRSTVLCESALPSATSIFRILYAECIISESLQQKRPCSDSLKSSFG